MPAKVAASASLTTEDTVKKNVNKSYGLIDAEGALSPLETSLDGLVRLEGLDLGGSQGR